MELMFRNLSKSYGDIRALDDFSLKISEGIYGILGPNGAGKSTLMKLISDNTTRSGGEILFDGMDILVLGKSFRGVLGYMPQEQGYYENMSAYAFLSYIARLKGISKRNTKVEIKRLLELVNLSSVAHKKLGCYSGGMKQRVLLAQALLGDPKVLILDEPTAGLDPKERIRIRNFIATLAQNRIIIMATHIVGDIESISNYIILMKNGKLLCSMSYNELINSISGSIWQIVVDLDKAVSVQSRYPVGSMIARDGRMTMRIVATREDAPQGAVCITDEKLTLEDVYLYYLGQ